MSQSGNELLAALHDLRQSITTEAAKRIARWLGDIELPSFAASADNLAHYLAFRHHDLRDLQLELMRYGLSSLGRLESRVLITLQTVETALSALLSGKPTGKDWPPSSEQFFHGEAQLQANTRVLLGGTADHSGGRILVTLSGEAAQDPADTWAAMIENTRKAGDAVGRRIPVLMDIAGPKFRIGNVKRQAGERLVAGDRFRMVADAAMFGSDAAIEAVCEPGDVLDHLAVGTEVVFDDGKLAGMVEESQNGSVLVRVTRTQRKGFKMKPERGLTFPRADL